MGIKKINITILGSSGMIGSSLAKRFLSDGNHINLFYRSKKKKNFLKKKLNFLENKNKINFYQFNFSSEKKIINSIQRNRKIFMNTDLLILTIAEQGEISNFFESNLTKLKKTLLMNIQKNII